MAVLRLEHHSRIQTKLTALVQAHCGLKHPDPEEFVQLIIECENVHIVTFRENYDAMSAKGDYRKAGIELKAWRDISTERREVLWKRVLRGKVVNASDFAPLADPT
jgi:hypothetical protein